MILFLHVKEENFHLENNKHKIPLPLFIFHGGLTKLRKNKNEIVLKHIFIDQSKLPPKIYNYLKRSNIHTLLDLLNNNEEDLMKMNYFLIKTKQILDILEIKKYFT